MAHRHRKSGQQSFKPEQGNYYPDYGPSWENNFNYMYPINGYQGPIYPFAPYPRYFPHQHYPYHYQPCYCCGHGQQFPGQRPNYVEQGKNPYAQQHAVPEHSSPAVQYPSQRKKQKPASFSQAKSEVLEQEQHPSTPCQSKHRSK